MKKVVFAISLGLFLASTPVWAQDFKTPEPSPLTTIKQDFSTSFIELKYSRPGIKGRTVFGELVPYGKIWRTGANDATRVTFGEEVEINGKKIAAGTYALYTIPNANEWTVILNKGIGNWGAAGFKESDDVARFTVKPTTTSERQENFFIGVDALTINSCEIVLAWDKTKVSIPVKTNNDERITKYYENAINNPNIPYAKAAGYYLETGKNLDKAVSYADKAIAANPNAFWLHWLKARVYKKQGKKSEALAAAKVAAEKAKGSPYADEYQRNYEGFQAELK